VEPRHILLTGGRAPATLDLARQFARAGHCVVVAESIPLHLCRTSHLVKKCYQVPPPNAEPAAFIAALEHIIRAEGIDLLIPTCEEVFFVARGLEQLRELCCVCASPLAQMRRLHSKWDFVQAARQYGLPVPETHLLTSRADLHHFCIQRSSPFVLKPVFSRFATHVHVIERAEQALCHQLTISPQYPWVAQERIVGQAFSSYSIAYEGRLLAHTVYPETFTAGQGACIHFQAVEQSAIEQWVVDFLRHERFSGQIACDFIVTAAGTVYPLECNPRATSGVHLFGASNELNEAFFNARATADTLKPRPGTRAMLGLAMLFCGLPTIRSIKQFRRWARLFFGSRDVLFALDDPIPFFAQTFVLGYNWLESRRRRISIAEFTTRDIEWNGQQ